MTSTPLADVDGVGLELSHGCLAVDCDYTRGRWRWLFKGHGGWLSLLNESHIQPYNNSRGRLAFHSRLPISELSSVDQAVLALKPGILASELAVQTALFQPPDKSPVSGSR